VGVGLGDREKHCLTRLGCVGKAERRKRGRSMVHRRGLTDGAMIGIMRSVVVMMRIATGGRPAGGPKRGTLRGCVQAAPVAFLVRRR